MKLLLSLSLLGSKCASTEKGSWMFLKWNFPFSPTISIIYFGKVQSAYYAVWADSEENSQSSFQDLLIVESIRVRHQEMKLKFLKILIHCTLSLQSIRIAKLFRLHTSFFCHVLCLKLHTVIQMMPYEYQKKDHLRWLIAGTLFIYFLTVLAPFAALLTGLKVAFLYIPGQWNTTSQTLIPHSAFWQEITPKCRWLYLSLMNHIFFV